MVTHRCLLGCAAVLGCIQSAAAAIGFATLNAWPGTYGEGAADMTPDGSIVVGGIKSFGSSRWETYRWSAGTGFESPGWEVEGGSLPRAVSADGHVIVGTVNADIGYNTARPFYWKDGEGLTLPGLLPGGSYGWATGVSADGSTMVGYGNNPDSVAWKWTAAGGYQLLPTPTGFNAAWVTQHGISATGDTIVGYVRDGNNNTFPIRWSASGAEVCPVAGYGQAIQSDGHAVLFASNGAMRWWDDGRIETLGEYPNAWATWPNASSEDGSIVGGSGVIAAYTGRAWIWTASLGLVDLRDYLQAQGIDLSGWVLSSVVSISADGTKICGFGTHTYSPAYSRQETFIATVPGPACAFIPAIGVIAMRASRPRRIARTLIPIPGSAARC